MQGQSKPIHQLKAAHTIDTVWCFTNETGTHEYNPNLSNSVLQTVRGLPLEK